MDIQAPNGQDEISAALNAAVGESAAGVLYPMGPRQAETERLLDSPPGFADFSILSGSAAGWPADVTP